jgi:CRISPR system Cascade subunit CasD
MSTPVHRQWLVLRLEAPLVAFGGVTIDAVGVIRDFPALSMLTGLFANALGYERTERQRHQDLQDRIVFAARLDGEPHIGVLRDNQNVQDLDKEKRGWTTRGMPEERGGGSLGAIHRRQRDYHPDALVAVVVTLEPAAQGPTLEDLAAALDRPARPLFIGRKPCLPVAPLRHRLADGKAFLEAATAHEALSLLPRLTPLGEAPRHRRSGSSRRIVAAEATPLALPAQWPAGEGPADGPLVDRSVNLADRRNWLSGLHGGTRHVVEGRIAPPVGGSA